MRAFLRSTIPTLLITLLSSKVALAASYIPNPNTTSNGLTQYFFRDEASSDPNAVLNNLWTNAFSLIFLIIGGVAVVILIYAGIQYITAGGNAERTKKARQAIIMTVAGIILLVSTYGVINLIQSLAQTASSTVK